MAEIFGILLLSLAGGAATAALLALLPWLMPEVTEQAQQVLAAAPGRAFAVGLVNVIFFSIIAAVSSQIGQALPGLLGGLFGLGAITILWLLLVLAMLGTAGLVLLVQQRVSGPAGKPGPAHYLPSSLLLVAAALAPIAGWFVLAPLALVTGVGAAILATIQLLRPPQA